MRAPLDEFANRLLRNGEITEFVQGLINEKGVDPHDIISAAQATTTPINTTSISRGPSEYVGDPTSRPPHSW